jgi:hypothetical protein
MLIRIFSVTVIIFLAALNGLSSTIPDSQERVTVEPFGKVEVIHSEIEIEWLPEVQVVTNFDEIEGEFIAHEHVVIGDDTHFEVVAALR